MPATDMGWSLEYEQQTVCNAFGNKRKNSEQDNSEDSQYALASKRQCRESQSLADRLSGGQLMDVPSQHEPQLMEERSRLQHYHMEEISQQQQQQQVQITSPHALFSHVNHQPVWDHSHISHMHIPHEAGDHSAVFNNNNNNNNCSNNNNDSSMDSSHCREENNNQVMSFSQDAMIMDLTDEVYSASYLDPTRITTDAEYEAACSMMAAMEGEGAPDPEQYRPHVGGRQHIGGDHLTHSPGRVTCLSKNKPSPGSDCQPYISDYY